VKAKRSVAKLSPSQRRQWLALLQKHAKNQIAGLSNSKNYYRIVIDTNVLLSAILYGGKPKKVLQHILAHQELVLSDYIVDEFVNYLKTIKIPQKFIRQARQKLEEYCRDYDMSVDEKIRDINDTEILRLAITHNALIITGDKDILEYKAKSKVSVLTVSEYIELFIPND